MWVGKFLLFFNLISGKVGSRGVRRGGGISNPPTPTVAETGVATPIGTELMLMEL